MGAIQSAVNRMIGSAASAGALISGLKRVQPADKQKMKQSLLFVPTLRDMPKDAEIASHKILLKGGYIKQHAAGVYTYMPLAHRLIKTIENIP